MIKLANELEMWRAERPDEWKMDEFIRNAKTLTAERDALVVQVEVLRAACQLGIDMFVVNCINVPNTIETMQDAIDATPAQCLAAHDAEVAAKAVEYSVDLLKRLPQHFQTKSKEFYNGVEISVEYLSGLSRQLRQQAKPAGWLKDSNTHCKIKGGE
ncbi:hypothetical protein [Arsukibacterium sp.]|uniref:hypothetical protein n=1 Tax=Arsukibacterium sp. TaxID=1977258 RepID=UPI002FD8F45E